MTPKSILITGASSGLGEALALHYAAPDVTLFLSGRDGTRLTAVAEHCRRIGSDVHPHIVDVTDDVAMTAWIMSCDAIRALDLVIANAGISAGTAGGPESAAQTRSIFATNVDGVINTVLPATETMAARRHGQIAIISSLASFRGMPGAPAYCASKAAIRVWGEGLRLQMAAQGIALSVVCPGFVRTPMTSHNDFSMPFLMGAGRAARIIAHGLACDRGRIAFPWRLYALSWLAATLPDAIMEYLSSRLPKKT